MHRKEAAALVFPTKALSVLQTKWFPEDSDLFDDLAKTYVRPWQQSCIRRDMLYDHILDAFWHWNGGRFEFLFEHWDRLMSDIVPQVVRELGRLTAI